MTDALTQYLTTADGRTLCFADWGAAPGGAPDGVPVFTLHGSAGCRLGPGLLLRSPEQIAAVGARLIMYDRPGYGRSDRRPGSRVGDHVADVEAIANALGLEEFAITGGSGGAPHALAVAAGLPTRVVRVSNFGALAPFDVMGLDEYQRDQDDDTCEYLAQVRESEAACTAIFEKLDAEMRAGIEPEDPMREALLESTRQGVAGWVDDERALQQPWGFDVADVIAPAAIWANPIDRTTPPNHAEWIVDHLPNAVLVSSTNAVGHCAIEDADRARSALYTWLVQGGEPIIP